MRLPRRRFLGSGAVLLAGLGAAGLVRAGPAVARPWNKAAFEARTLKDTLAALGGENATESKDIEFVDPTPGVAENGDVVPIAVSSKVPGTRWIGILVEKNPVMLSASFNIPERTEAFVSTRVKMVETSGVIAVAKAGEKYFYARKEIQVTQCGCGG
ncbi:MAG: thiosulfate oxidation carrier protein SoxY [Betaproteobacteria bacterium]|nr:thiosulfate oxidation carrier protein SoxY [Betaproteobacteria bacterium]